MSSRIRRTGSPVGAREAFGLGRVSRRFTRAEHTSSGDACQTGLASSAMPARNLRVDRPDDETAFARAEREARAERVARFDALAPDRDRFRAKNRYYHGEIERLTRFFVPKGASVLEIGSATGDLLAALEPSRGVGVDFSPRMVEIARAKHPGLEFRVGDAQDLDLDEQFDFVVMSDVVGYLDDVWAALRSLRRVMRPESRLVLTYYNFLWEPVLELGKLLGRKMPVPLENWLGKGDLANLLGLCDLDVVTSGSATLVPAEIPVVSALANRLLARAPGFDHLALVQYFVARPAWQHKAPAPPQTCTVVVPCKNERGNVADIFARTPTLGAGTEL